MEILENQVTMFDVKQSRDREGVVKRMMDEGSEYRISNKEFPMLK